MTTTLTSVSIDQFLSSLSENGQRSNTIRAYRSDLLGLLTWMENQPEASPEAMAAKYLNEHRDKWAPTTTRRKLGTFRAWAKWAGIGSFLDSYRPPTPNRPQPHPIDDGIPAVLAMIDACGADRRRVALVALCGLCGLRVHEALALRPRDVDLANKVVTVRGKGDKTRTVPMSDRAFGHIVPAVTLVLTTENEQAPLINLSDRWARELVTKLAKKAGISQRVSSHDLRATLATAAYGVSHDLRAVQELLGHASSKTTEVYTGVTSAAMRRAVEVA